MATAMARTEAAVGSSSLSSRHSLPPQSRPALESAVDAYATRVLRLKSPPEACVDDSLGPYVTSILRCSLGDSNSEDSPDAVDVYDMDVENVIEDFDSLVELLEGHCGMDREVAKNALHSIAIAVKTGVVGSFDDGGEQHVAGSFNSVGHIGTSFGSIISFDGSHGGGRLGRPFRSRSVGAVNDHDGMDAIQFLGDMLRDTDIGGRSSGEVRAGINEPGSDSSPDGIHEEEVELPSFIMDKDTPLDADDLRSNFHTTAVRSVSAPSTPQQSSGSSSPDQVGKECTEIIPSGTPVFTPMKLDRLIPVDLMGVLDNPATPAPAQAEVEVEKEKVVAHSEEPTAEDVADKQTRKGKGKKKSKAKAQDLAAALFRSSRARSNSIPHEKSPKLKPLSGPPPALLSSSPIRRSSLFQQQLDSATQILLSMNNSLGEEAAMEAALVSNNDVNVAQYVIDGAMAAPPVCRHMLHDGCYRSDCHFSHDVEGHTCLFWLRGRCGKGETCRFMHGFSEKLLEGIKKDFLPEHHQKGSTPYALVQNVDAVPIQTTNLVQHNMNVPFSAPKHGDSPFAFLHASQRTGEAAFGESSLSSTLPVQNENFGAPTVAPVSIPAEPSMMEFALNERSESEATTEALMESNIQKWNDPIDGKSSAAWSSVAQRGYSLKTSFSQNEDPAVPEAPQKAGKKPKVAKIPQDLWNPSDRRSSAAFHIADSMVRYAEVSSTHPRKDVLDLHFQSVKTFSVVLSQVLPAMLLEHEEVWVVTGSGHHVNRNSHQKGGGVLESAVMSWLEEHGYEYLRGKDRNGYCGAVLVKQR